MSKLQLPDEPVTTTETNIVLGSTVRLPDAPSDASKVLTVLADPSGAAVVVEGNGMEPIALQPGEERKFVAIDTRKRSDDPPNWEWCVLPPVSQ